MGVAARHTQESSERRDTALTCSEQAITKPTRPTVTLGRLSFPPVTVPEHMAAVALEGHHPFAEQNLAGRTWRGHLHLCPETFLKGWQSLAPDWFPVPSVARKTGKGAGANMQQWGQRTKAKPELPCFKHLGKKISLVHCSARVAPLTPGVGKHWMQRRKT